MCLRSMRKAAAAGATTVVERASSHPTRQRTLLEREYDEHDVEVSVVDERLYQRALTELREADAVFVPSKFVYESFLERGFSESKLKLVPFGVDTTAFRPSTDSGETDSFRALFVGQVSLRKGVQYLLPAWRRSGIDGELVFAGQVTDDAESVVKEYRNDDSIRFLGWVDDIPDEFHRADAFVFPSIEEGSALVSYEAMASGLPSIVTPNVGSLVEDGEHGVVVPPRDIGALADALSELAESPELRSRMGRAAREKVSDYSWERYGDRVADVYRNILQL